MMAREGRRRILVIGYYGAGNTGDEAVLTALLRGLRAGGRDLEFIVPGESPERLAAAHGVVSFLPSDLGRLLDAVESADLVLLGGGGLLHDYWDPRPETLLTPEHWGLTYYCGIPWLAGELGKPVMLYAVGVGPLLFESGRDLVRDAAMTAQAITVRDEASARLLAELGVTSPRPRVTADPVWGLDPIEGEALSRLKEEAGIGPGPWLGVAVRNWNVGVSQKGWEKELLAGLGSFARRSGFGVLFLPFQRASTPLQDDLGLARKLSARLEGIRTAVVERPCLPEELGGLVGDCAALVGMRLHSLLFGCQRGVPAVALEYDPKVALLAGRVSPPLPVLKMGELTAASLEAALEQVWRDREQVARGELALAARLRSAAAGNDEIALGLLDRPPAIAAKPGARRLLETARRLAAQGVAAEPVASAPVPARAAVRIIASGFFDPKGSNMFFGGAERYLLELSRVIRSMGYSVEVFQRAEKAPWVRHYGDLRVCGVPTDDPFELNAAVARHGAAAPALTIYLAFYLAGSDAPAGSIGVSHGVYWDDSFYQKDEEVRRRHLRRIWESIESLDTVVSVDTNTINWVRASRADLARKCVYLPNFVDRREYFPSAPRGSSRLAVLYPRRLHPPRGFWLVAEILPALLEEHPELDFHFVGKANEAEQAAVEKLVARHPGRVRWSFLPPERMREAYEEADIVVIPTVSSEGTSLSCLEAQSCGKAVIATHVGGLPDVVLHEHNGLLVEPEPGALRSAIDRLVADPSLRERLGRNAAETAEHFSLDRWRRRWRDLLRGHLPARPPAARRLALRFPVTALFPAPPAGKVRPESHREFARRLARYGVDTYWVQGEEALPSGSSERLHFVPRGEELSLSRPLVILADRGQAPNLTGIDRPRIVYDLPPDPRPLLKSVLKERRQEVLRNADEHEAPEAPGIAERDALVVRLRRELAEARSEARLLRSERATAVAPAPSGLDRDLVAAQEDLERRHAELAALASRRAETEKELAELTRPSAGTIVRRRAADYDVIVLPIISWEFRFQRPQQIATQFGRHGHRVFYLSLIHYLPPEGPAWDLVGKAPNVAELRIRSARTLKIYDSRLEWEDLEVLEQAFGVFARDQEIRNATLVVQIPFWAPLAERFRKRFGWRVVYDCMDEWTNFPGFGWDVLSLESGLVRDADVTVVSAERLAEKWRPTARRLVLAQNGVDLTHYFSRYGANEVLGGVAHPIIGYYGALASWVDVALLEKIARRFPHATIVLAGEQFDVDLSPVSALPNVRLLGQRPYEEMPWLLWSYDVCIIPFLINDITEATNPVKFYEYSFGGKPVVAPDLPELRPYAGLCYLARGHEEFLDGIEKALAEPVDDRRRQLRRQIAASNDWEMRYRAIDAAIREADATSTVRVSLERLREVFLYRHARENRLKDELQAETRRRELVEKSLKDELEEEMRRRELAEKSLEEKLATVKRLHEELLEIHHSRFWKIATFYWRLLDRKNRIVERLRGRGQALPAGAPSPEAEPRPGRRKTEKARPVAPAPKAALLAPVARSDRYDVICLPIIEWDFRFQRPQQLMSRYAAAGHRVFYVSLELRPAGEAYSLTPKAPNVYEVSLRGPSVNVYKQGLSEDDAEALAAVLDELRRDVGLAATAVFVQLPFWWPVARRLRERRFWPVVYDWMDDHSGFSSNRQAMLREEAELQGAADLVLASSALLEQKARQAARNVLLLRNAGDYAHFENAGAGRERGARPVIGYYGAIADWFDSELVAEVARRRPDWDFLLVGSTWSADLKALSKLPNVRLAGEKPYAEIPDWLAKFDVAFIPFKRTPLTEATNPVKAYEILSSGKPLVSVPLPEMAALGSLVRVASGPADLERAIAEALAERDPDAVERRKAFARENTWEKRFEALEPAVRSTFPEASIIIVTFNNLELNRQCLESVYERTEWPNFEVIVVDNGSVDGTPAYLREAEKKYPNLRLFLNEDNKGFAGGNNIGLKAARGEILVLLNNDTGVSRGWLTSLARHLRANPELGLVGPVTNEIGNEAKIPVGYRTLEEMPEWAARYVRDNDGRTMDIPMLAMFCVAMRRDVLDKVGLLDESFEIGMFEDDDYTRRLRAAGFRVTCACDAFVHHAGRASFKLLGDTKYLEVFERNRRIYQEKWGEVWLPHVDERDRKRIPKLQEELAAIVRDSGVSSDRVVVFLPSIGWNTPLVQRPQHLAGELARQGFLVFFDCTGSVIDDFTDFLEVEKNLWLYRGPTGVLDKLESPVLWTLTYNVPLIERWPRRRVVYDWIDDLSVFPYNRQQLEEKHQRMLKEADLVLYVARKLGREIESVRPDAVYVPNGVEYERFAAVEGAGEGVVEEFARLVEAGRPIVGYYGAIASWMDAGLLAETAQRREDWSFVLIGHKLPDSPSLRKLRQRGNVLILGAQPYPTLPAYLSRFTAAMIPFKVNTITEATSPLKLFEYFAAGKPVISTAMPECRAFPEVHIVGDAAEFSAALDASALEVKDPDFANRMRELGRASSWTARIRSVAEHLAKPAARSPEPPAPRPGAPPRVETPGPPPAAPGLRKKDLPKSFASMRQLSGRCNICGTPTTFYFENVALYRESLYCGQCLSTSRYRSIARGILRAAVDLAGVEAESLTGLAETKSEKSLRIYDTQPAFAFDGCAYPVPDVLARCPWIEVQTSSWRPRQPRGASLGANWTNQDLEKLAFPADSFDVVVTSDLLQHVRLDEAAYAEIRRVLKPGGVYLFTVPHFRDREETFARVEIVDPADPGKDRYVVEKQYLGNFNWEEGRALLYRSYGTELDEVLREQGFEVDYSKKNFPEAGIMNTELFYCKLSK